MARVSDSAPVDELKDLLACSLCSKTLNEPRSLSCLHSFCKVCLGEYIRLVSMNVLLHYLYMWMWSYFTQLLRKMQCKSMLQNVNSGNN